MFGTGKILKLNCYNWVGKNSQGMFDYSLPIQSPDICSTTLQTNQKHSSIFRHKTSFELVLAHQINGKNKQQYDEICKIEFKDDQYLIKNVRSSAPHCPEQFMCKKALSSYENSFLLKKDSVMKIGKSKLEVVEIKLHEKPMAQRKTFYDSTQNRISYKQKESIIALNLFNNNNNILTSTIDEVPTCRYCFSAQMNSQNPFMALCKCDGSSKYVHQDCLSSWITHRSKYNANIEEGIYSVEKMGLKCEICQEYFPVQKVLPCFLDKKLESYMILQYKDHKEKEKETIYVVDLVKKKQVSIGRSLKCTLSLDDLSISRHHCTLLFDSYTGSVFVADENSKFGTLIKCSAIKIDSETEIQRGRTKIKAATVEKRFTFPRLMNNYFC